MSLRHRLFFLSFISVCEESDSESYDETQALLTSDFEIGHLIRERVVPNAVLFFTGKLVDSIMNVFAIIVVQCPDLERK